MTPFRYLRRAEMKIKISQRKSVREPYPEPCSSMIW
jgi:hypothetical protein